MSSVLKLSHIWWLVLTTRSGVLVPDRLWKGDGETSLKKYIYIHIMSKYAFLCVWDGFKACQVAGIGDFLCKECLY